MVPVNGQRPNEVCAKPKILARHFCVARVTYGDEHDCFLSEEALGKEASPAHTATFFAALGAYVTSLPDVPDVAG